MVLGVNDHIQLVGALIVASVRENTVAGVPKLLLTVKLAIGAIPGMGLISK